MQEYWYLCPIHAVLLTIAYTIIHRVTCNQDHKSMSICPTLFLSYHLLVSQILNFVINTLLVLQCYRSVMWCIALYVALQVQQHIKTNIKDKTGTVYLHCCILCSKDQNGFQEGNDTIHALLVSIPHCITNNISCQARWWTPCD